MAKQERIEQAAVCREIGARTGGDILIGVVGPVRTGKSTLIKQFMEKLVLPAIGPSAWPRCWLCCGRTASSRSVWPL